MQDCYPDIRRCRSIADRYWEILMKILPFIAIAAAFVAAPVLADTVHRTSLEHQGQTVSVSYEPRAKTSLRQSGLGPRSVARCLWKTELSVERKIAQADGRPIVALTRTLGATHTASGVIDGYCNHARPHEIAAFRGDRQKLQAFVSEAAAHDTRTLHAELASLGSLGRGLAR
jgi:hypothetical protein